MFVNENGSHLDPSIVRKRYKRALERARQREGEIPVLRFHDLRHTFGSLLASGGVDLVSIKSYMGHANMSTTMIYLHHVSAKDAAEKLTRLFEEKQIEQIEEQEEPEAA